MVGPTCWIEAGAAVLGLKEEQFLAAYLDSQGQAGHMALDASLIGGPLCDMLAARDQLAELPTKDPKAEPYVGPVGFNGIAKQLLGELTEFMRSTGRAIPRGWPRTARGMGSAMRSIAPALRKIGYVVGFGEREPGTGRRIIAIDTPRSLSRRQEESEKDRHNRHDRHTPPENLGKEPKEPLKSVTVGVEGDRHRSSQTATPKSDVTVCDDRPTHDRHRSTRPKAAENRGSRAGRDGRDGCDGKKHTQTVGGLAERAATATTPEAVAPPIPEATKASLLKNGVHPSVVEELTPTEAERLLSGDPVIIPPNASHPPLKDLRELAEVLGRVPIQSAAIAHEATRYAGGATVTAEEVDAIKAGESVPFTVRDAIWTALS
jgi:hypothetical protein